MEWERGVRNAEWCGWGMAWEEVIVVDGEGVAGVAAGEVAGQRLYEPARLREAGRWVELRDGRGKLQGKYDPVKGVLEIQRRGVRTRYVLGEAGALTWVDLIELDCVENGSL